MTTPGPSPPAGAAADTVRIHASRFKHFLLALPCAYLAVLGAQAVKGGTGPDGVGIALIAFGVLAAGVLMLVGFSRDPVLVVDDAGIFCRRPALGLIPWHAIVGLGLGRGLLSRAVLVVGYDEAALESEAVERLKRERPSALLGPRLGRFRGEMAGHPTVQIPLSMLAVRPARLQRLLEERLDSAAGPA